MKDILLPVAHVFALVMMVFAVTMLAPLIMAVWELDPALWSFILSAVTTFMLGALLWITYGMLIGAWPVIIANLLVFAAAAWTSFRKSATLGPGSPA